MSMLDGDLQLLLLMFFYFYGLILTQLILLMGCGLVPSCLIQKKLIIRSDEENSQKFYENCQISEVEFFTNQLISHVHTKAQLSQVLSLCSNLAQSEILKSCFSFTKTHNFSDEKCCTCLQFLCAFWKFHKNSIKSRFICAASSISLTEVSKQLSFFLQSYFSYSQMTFGVKINNVPCVSRWILNFDRIV